MNYRSARSCASLLLANFSVQKSIMQDNVTDQKEFGVPEWVAIAETCTCQHW